MKQESAKKTPKWLLPVIIAAAVLVVAGIVLAIFLPTLGQEGEGAPIQSKLYWNVDRLANIEEESGMSIRQPGADGLYAIRFAVGGEQVEYKCADKRLVNAIDIMSVMGLVFDEDGLIVDCLDPKTVATEVAKDVFTKSYNGNLLETNSSMAMNGMTVRIQITDAAGIWDVSPDAEVAGQKGEPALLDMISAYADADGVVTDVFITKRAKEAGVYYRIGTYYNSNTASTTREPDENGVYTMTFAHEGEQVDLKCKDKALVDNLDALTDAKVQMGLLFDEEGYISERISVAEAVKGKLLYSMYDVTAVSGNMITAESKWSSAKDKGEIVDFEISEDCDDIFLMETKCGAKFAGERVSGLQVGDRVYVYSDFANNPVLIFITHRGQDYPIYYNLSRKYDSEKQETKRTPEGGWYVYEMAAAGGDTVTLKTDNKDLATRIDAFSPQYMGVKATNGIIENVCDVVCVGGRSGLSCRYVTEIMGTIHRVVSGSDLSSGSNLVLAPDCQIYDLTGDFGVKLMSKTTLQLNDRVSIIRNAGNEIAIAFVTDRYMEGAKIYENLDRQYSSKNQETKREPDENGYYVYDMLCEGKQVQVKTKDKKMANYIDKVSNRFLALKVSGGLVKDATSKYYSGIQYGARVMSAVYFDHIDSDGKVHYYTIADGEKVLGVSSVPLASGYKVYNHSEAYETQKGEKTTLKKGDYIYAIWDRMSRTISQIFVRTRDVDGPLYWHVKRQYNSTKEETTRQVAADGYYYIDLVTDGQIKTFKTKSKDIASRVDAYSYAFGMGVKGDTILYPVSATYVKGIEKHLYRFTYVKEIKGNTVITETVDATSANYGKDLELKYTKNSKIYDVCTYSEGFGKATTLNIGDRVVSYVDEKENVVYSFVDYKCTREAGFRSVCEHCQKEVVWTPFVGTIATQDMHYYLPNDRSRSTRTIGYTAAELAANSERKQYKTCFDLNGHTLTSPERNFTINSTLNVMDSAGGGKLVSGSGPSLRLSFSGGAEVNVYGGTFAKSADAPAVTGALIYGGSCTVNIYDGTFIGGNAPTGGIAHMGTNSVLNIEGGTFQGGTAETAGDSIYMVHEADKPSTLAMRNCKIDGGIECKGKANIVIGTGVEIGNAKGVGIALSSSQKLDVSKMDTTTSVYITANGIFTTERDDIDTIKDCFKPISEYGKITKDGKALRYDIVVPLDPETDTQKRVEKWVEKVKADGAFAASGELPITCPICNGVGVNWQPVSGGFTTEKTGGHYYFSDGGTINYNYMNLIATPYNGEKACIYLNDHDISIHGRIRVRSGEFNIFGDGSITKTDNDGDNREMPLFNVTTYSASSATLNIYGGNYTTEMTETNVPGGVPIIGVTDAGTGTSVNIYGGTFTVAQGAAGKVMDSTAENTTTIYGGIFNGEVAANANTTLNLAGAPVISNLTLATGKLVNVDELTAQAQISVMANGVFTTERDDIETIKPCFAPIGEDAVIQISDKALRYGITVPMDPETNTQKRVENWVTKVKADGAFAADGELPITCPICNGVGVTWEVASPGMTVAKTGGHYYFSNGGTITYNSMNLITTPYNGEKACVYLNDHDISIKGRIRLRAGELNIFGDGNVTKLDNDSSNKEMPLLNVTTYTTATATLNIYGGTYTTAMTETNVPGGVPIIGVTDAGAGTSVNLYGVNFNVAQGAAGKVIDSSAANITTIYGGTFNGEVAATENTVLNLMGAPMISSLTLADGVVANIDELDATAQIAVAGEAGKVISNASANAEAVKDCFTVAEGLKVEIGATGALTIAEITVAPPAPTEPGAAEKAAVDAWVAQVKADGAFAENGTLPTTCPFCNETVTWEAKSGSFTTAQSGGHYYFSNGGTITYNNMNLIATPYNGVKACVYLNDHNISIKGRIRLRGGELNIFGDGSVTKVDNDSDNKAMPLLNVTTYTTGTATLNIYGGTYTTAMTAANVPGGVPVIGVTDAGAGTFVNIYGGTFNVAQGAAGKVMDSTAANTTTIYNGTFNGEIAANESTVLNLAGKPVIPNLTLASNTVVNVDAMSPEARITVNAVANQVITNASENAEAVKDCFTVADGLKVELVDKTLVVKANEPNPAQNVIDWVAANGAAFRAEGKLETDATVSAPCPFCSPDNNVTWTGISSNSTLTDGCHVYWINDWLKVSTHNAIVGGSTTSSHCVYMNGFNAGGQKQDGSYYTAGNRIRARGGLNLIAYGSTVVRASGSTADAATYPSVIQAEGVAKIYGGTFVNADSNVPLLRITQDTTNVEIYDAVLQGTGNCVINNTAGKAGTLSLYNCTVVSNDPAVKAISLTGGTLTLHSGTVTGGVELAESVVLNLTGNPVVDSGLPAAQQGIQSQEENSQSVKN